MCSMPFLRCRDAVSEPLVSPTCHWGEGEIPFVLPLPPPPPTPAARGPLLLPDAGSSRLVVLRLSPTLVAAGSRSRLLLASASDTRLRGAAADRSICAALMSAPRQIKLAAAGSVSGGGLGVRSNLLSFLSSASLLLQRLGRDRSIGGRGRWLLFIYFLSSWRMEFLQQV
jgi:hypothetical protein